MRRALATRSGLTACRRHSTAAAASRLAELDAVASIDPASATPWRGVRHVWHEGSATPVASAFWVEPFSGRKVLVVSTRSRRVVNGWVAQNAVRPARRRRRAAERAGLASRVYTGEEEVSDSTIWERLGLVGRGPVWGSGGRAGDESYLSSVPDTDLLDGPLCLRLADTERTAAQAKGRPGAGSSFAGDEAELLDRSVAGLDATAAAAHEPGAWLDQSQRASGKLVAGAGLPGSQVGGEAAAQLRAGAGGTAGFHSVMRLSPMVRPAPQEGMAASSIGGKEHEECAQRCLVEAAERAAAGERSWSVRAVDRLWAGRPGGAGAPNASASRRILRAELDPQHAAMLERVRFGASQVVIGLDAEWSSAPPSAAVPAGRAAHGAWGVRSPVPGAGTGRMPRPPDAADVVQLATHNAVLVASLSQ